MENTDAATKLIQYLVDSDDTEAADVVRSLIQERDEAKAAMKEMRSIMEQQIDRAEALTTSAMLLNSLCAWLLHRFGPDSPEGQEASFRAIAARNALAARTRTRDYRPQSSFGPRFVFGEPE